MFITVTYMLCFHCKGNIMFMTSKFEIKYTLHSNSLYLIFKLHQITHLQKREVHLQYLKQQRTTPQPSAITISVMNRRECSMLWMKNLNVDMSWDSTPKIISLKTFRDIYCECTINIETNVLIVSDTVYKLKITRYIAH